MNAEAPMHTASRPLRKAGVPPLLVRAVRGLAGPHDRPVARPVDGISPHGIVSAQQMPASGSGAGYDAGWQARAKFRHLARNGYPQLSALFEDVIQRAAQGSHAEWLSDDERMQIEAARTADGIVLGPVSHLNYPPPPRQQGGIDIAAELRIVLHLYANIRPSRSRAEFLRGLRLRWTW